MQVNKLVRPTHAHFAEKKIKLSASPALRNYLIIGTTTTAMELEGNMQQEILVDVSQKVFASWLILSRARLARK
jgi:hypothetical protein